MSVADLLPKHWVRKSIFDLQSEGIILVEDGNHGNDRPRKDEFVEDANAISFIRAADIKNGCVDFSSASKINEVAFNRIRKGKALPGDIIITHKGTVGTLAFVPPHYEMRYVCSPQTTFYRSLNEDILDRDFLYLFMRSSYFLNQFNMFAGETDMAPYVSLTNQRKINISFPPINEQKKIKKIIKLMDEKIYENTRYIEKLQTLAFTYFKTWFVEHEESFHEAETNADKEITNIKKLPSGWKEESLDKNISFLNGLALQKYPPENNASDLPILKIAQLKKGNLTGGGFASNKIPKKYIIRDGDLIFSWSASLIIDIWCGGMAALNQHLFKVSSEVYPAWFQWQWCLFHLHQFQAIAKSKATTMGHIQRKHLTEAKIFVPPHDAMKKYNDIFNPLWERIINCNLETKSLEGLKDALIPKLLTGEINSSNVSVEE